MTKRNYYILLFGSFVALMIAAFHRQLLVDDAFISFRYARNLVDGFGLVWNPGEQLEGYSNFLWLMLIAAGMKVGWEPERFSYIISIPIHLTGLVATYFLARQVFTSALSNIVTRAFDAKNSPTNRSSAVDIFSLVVLIWVGTNKSLFSFATSGLETSLQFALIALIALLAAKSITTGWNARMIVSISILMNLAFLSRLDAVTVVIPVLLLFFHRLFYTENYFTGEPYSKIIPARDRIKFLALMIAPFLLISLPWMLWKLSYYHRLFPNSFYAKVHGMDGIGFGLFYLYIFLTIHFLTPYLLLVSVKYSKLAKKNPAFGLVAGLALIWLIYVTWVGGDFMEFRFLVPVIPFIGISIIYTIFSIIMSKKAILALIAGMLLGNINSFFTIEKTVVTYGIETVENLAFHLSEDQQNWTDVGIRLKEVFGDKDVSIALAAAGAIPYYSGLPSIDYLGLCDAKIPEIGHHLSNVPGHRIIAPLEYMFDRRANLLIDPINYMVPNSEVQQIIRNADWRLMDKMHLKINELVYGNYINEATWLVIEINDKYSLLVWYITPEPEVDAIIRKHGFKRFRLHRPR